jgi:transcription termination factor NusB
MAHLLSALPALKNSNNTTATENGMKIRTTVLTMALLMSAACVTSAYAEATVSGTNAPSAIAAIAPAAGTPDAKPEKEQVKEQLKQDSSGLPIEKAKLYNEIMQKAIESNKDLRAQIHKAHDEADAIMTAEKFDKAAFLAKSAELDGLYAKQRAVMNDAFVSIMEKFSQEDRKTLIKARNERRHRNQQRQHG